MMSFARFMASAGGLCAICTTAGIALIATGLVLGGGWLALAAFGALLATGVLDLCPVAVLAKLPVTGDEFRERHLQTMTRRIPWAVSTERRIPERGR